MKLLYISVFFVLVVMSGCSKFKADRLDENPPHLITATTLYRSLAGFNAGLSGLYSLVRTQQSGENDYMAANIVDGTDNVTTNYVYLGFEQIAENWQNINNPSNLQYLRYFTFLYTVVNSANTIINNAEAEGVDWIGGGASPEENKNRTIAEARAIRAWAYRNLTYGWGDVPLNLEESSGATIKTDWERTPVAQVREQIIRDMKFAEEFIPVEPALQGRLTKGAIQTYLAEMYLVKGDPDSAFFWADKVINTPEYKLVTSRYGATSDEPGVPFMDMFQDGNENRVQGNTEALWVWQYQLNMTGGSLHNPRFFHNGRYFNIEVDGVIPLQLTAKRGARGVARMSMTKWALELYEPQDDRGSDHAIRKYFILRNAAENAPYQADILPPGWSYGDTIHLNWDNDLVAGDVFRPDWPFSRKFDAGSDPNNLAGGGSYNDLIIMRLAETYLLKAEAQYLMSDPGGAAATINVLRRRANASEVEAGDIDLDFILDERSRELVLEEDRRWTLLRTNKWVERTRLHNKNGGQFVAERDTLFPIPQAVIDANLTQPMRQNDGY